MAHYNHGSRDLDNILVAARSKDFHKTVEVAAAVDRHHRAANLAAGRIDLDNGLHCPASLNARRIRYLAHYHFYCVAPEPNLGVGVASVEGTFAFAVDTLAPSSGSRQANWLPHS